MKLSTITWTILSFVTIIGCALSAEDITRNENVRLDHLTNQAQILSQQAPDTAQNLLDSAQASLKELEKARHKFEEFEHVFNQILREQEKTISVPAGN